jgi:multiple sugar transport system substrate-binding protein
LALLAVAGVGASACTSSTGAGASASPQSSALDPNTTAELTLTYWADAQKTTIDANIKAFNAKYPNIKVTATAIGWEQYWTKARTQAESGTLPDVLWMNGPNIQLYSGNDQLATLDDAAIDWSQYPKALVDLYSLNGHHYGVPKDFDTVALWYNKALFTQAGVALPTASWTWDDFNAAAKQLGAALKSKNIWALMPDDLAYGQETFYNTIYQAGGFVIKDGKSGYDDPGTIRGLEFWSNLIKDGLCAPPKTIATTAGLDQFIAGTAAMFYGGSWNAKTIMSKVKDPTQFDVIDLPKDKVQASIIHGLGWTVSKNSKNMAAAKALVTYFGSKEAAITEASNGTAIPAYNGTQTQWLTVNPKWNLQVYLDAATKYSVAYPVSKNTSAWADKQGDLLTPGFDGSKPMADQAKALATVMNTALAAEK